GRLAISPPVEGGARNRARGDTLFSQDETGCANESTVQVFEGASGRCSSGFVEFGGTNESGGCTEAGFESRASDRDASLRGLPWSGRQQRERVVSEIGGATASVPRQAVERFQAAARCKIGSAHESDHDRHGGGAVR